MSVTFNVQFVVIVRYFVHLLVLPNIGIFCVIPQILFIYQGYYSKNSIYMV